MDGMALDLQNWFWDESFWLPQNVTWADLERTETFFIPKARDLWIPIPIAVLLFICRLFWERFVALPLGRYFRIKEAPPKRAVSQPILEEAFKKNRRVLPSHKVIEDLGKKIDWSSRQVERWWRRRRVQDKPSEMQRWRETSWRFLFYFTIFWYGIIVLWDKPYFWDTNHCWYGYPKQHVPLEIRAYYMIELGFYFSLLLSLFMDTKRKDFAEQMVHHFVTILLMWISWADNMVRVGALVLAIHDAVDWLLEDFLEQVLHHICTILLMVLSWANNMVRVGALVLIIHDAVDYWLEDFLEQIIHHICTIALMLQSYSTNMVRVGALVLVTHDAVDYWLEGAKLTKYAKYDKLCDVLFVIFTLVWFITRICLYPLRILKSTIYDTYFLFNIFGVYVVYNGLMVVLQLLNIYWFYIILRMLYRYILCGQVEKDERSETEPETNSDDDGIVASNGFGDHANGINSHANNNVKVKKIR